jgi:membrane fusion protein, multidrug efflux system
MDDQHSEVLPRSRGEIDGDAARFEFERPGVRPGDVVPKPARRSRLRWLVWLLLIVAIVGAAVWYLPRPGNQPTTGGRNQAGAPTPVGLAPVQKGDMPVILNQLGTVTPLATVTVQTQISGYMTEVGFQEGQIVKKGDFLAQIDPRPYQVALEQAQAQLAKDQAALADAELDLKRYKTLVAQNSIATQTLDTQVATVGQDRAQVMLDQAQIDTQKLNLTYCHIISPVTGRVGLRQVDPGNYVTPTSSPTGIVVVTQLQPISVIFTVPEDNLPDVFKRWHAGAVLPVTAYDRSGSVELDKGTLNTIDNQIDTTTGTVKLRAMFNNDQWELFPNQFVNVQLVVDTVHNVDIVPSAAIQRGAPGTFVYLAKPDHTVAVQKVKLGPGDGQRVAILEGLQPGENVVVDGADRLRDGAKVTVASSESGGQKDSGQPQAAAGQGGASTTDPEAATASQPTQPQSRQHQGQGAGRRNTQ